MLNTHSQLNRVASALSRVPGSPCLSEEVVFTRAPARAPQERSLRPVCRRVQFAAGAGKNLSRCRRKSCTNFVAGRRWCDECRAEKRLWHRMNRTRGVVCSFIGCDCRASYQHPKGVPVCAVHKPHGQSRAQRAASVLARTQRVRAANRAAGVCVVCAADLWPGNAQYCGPHVMAARERARRYREKRRAQLARVGRAELVEMLYGGRADMENVTPNFLDLGRERIAS
ncbi:MAG: hypothetical protein KGL39_48405 [Patescibacteria group bacterium]|nr:hypothetical protein [Patescibacteria group bacterium]